MVSLPVSEHFTSSFQTSMKLSPKSCKCPLASQPAVAFQTLYYTSDPCFLNLSVALVVVLPKTGYSALILLTDSICMGQDWTERSSKMESDYPTPFPEAACIQVSDSRD
jgi:hypothetical protein